MVHLDGHNGLHSPDLDRVGSNFEFRGFLLNETTVSWAITAFSLLFVPYVLFCFNTVTDGVFYGIGRTKYMAYQSIITNGSVYAIAFLLYVTGIWEPSFEGVMLLFSLGILVDSVLTMLFLLRALYFESLSGTETEFRESPSNSPTRIAT